MIDQLQVDIRSALSLITPMAVGAASKIRVGGIADGGYVMINDFPPTPICYSIGVGPDVSWDLDMAENRGAIVHQYDHTVEEAPAKNESCFFNKIGLGEHDDFPELKRLDTLITMNGDDGRNDLILKCDIEGAEWTALSGLVDGYFSRFDQIVMELHWLDHLADREFRRTWNKTIGNIASTHQCYHVHANNYGDVALVQGISIPQVIEVSFARRENRTFLLNEEMSPSELDTRNRADRADHFLGLFRF